MIKNRITKLLGCLKSFLMMNKKGESRVYYNILVGENKEKTTTRALVTQSLVNALIELSVPKDNKDVCILMGSKGYKQIMEDPRYENFRRSIKEVTRDKGGIYKLVIQR